MWGARYWLARVWTSRFWSATGSGAAPVDLPVTDDCSASVGTIDNQTMSDGKGVWSNSPAGVGFGYDGSGHIIADADTLTGQAVSTPSIGADQYAELVWHDGRGGPAVRLQSTESYGYYLYVRVGVDMRLQSWNGTTNSVLGVYSSPVSVGENIRIEVTGVDAAEVIKVYVSNSLEITVNATGTFDSGQPGIWSTTDAVEIDDYEAGDAPKTAPPSGRTTKNSRQWGMNTMPGTRLQMIVGGR